MATSSQVKSALDGIATMIAGATQQRERAKAQLLTARNQLANIPTQYSGEITTIDGYTPTGAFETLAKDEKSKLASEYSTLKTALENELDALGVSYS